MKDTEQTIETTPIAPPTVADAVIEASREPQPIMVSPRIIPAGQPLPGGTWELRPDGSRVEVVR